ncbi:MAG: histidinol-phosphatase [Kiritimatiellae bacterium]|nr:histidinol-phosphatase [Kiritimatiellia bacterium]
MKNSPHVLKGLERVGAQEEETNRLKTAFTANWHTHTWRCKHATGDVADYCRAAVDAGLTVLGFTDHMPLPNRRWISVRMSAEELPGYCQAIEEARPQFPGLRLHAALECEYLTELGGYYREELLGTHGLSYLAGAIHWFPYKDEWPSAHARDTANDPHALVAYTRHLLQMIASGLFAYIAHPDGFAMFYDCWDAETAAAARDIAQAARDANVPLEINAYGLRKPYMSTPDGERPVYPWAPFWDVVAACGAPAIVNSDAHRPEDIVGKVDEALALAARSGVRLVSAVYQE